MGGIGVVDDTSVGGRGLILGGKGLILGGIGLILGGKGIVLGGKEGNGLGIGGGVRNSNVERPRAVGEGEQ